MITALYAGLLGCFLLGLSVRVIARRRIARVGLGDGGDTILQRRIRAHANFVEYVPLVLILMALAELQTVSMTIVHAIGLCLVAGRVIHSLSVSREPEIPKGRVIGMALTFTSLGIASAVCLLASFGLMG